jgi:hypothetical protein
LWNYTLSFTIPQHGGVYQVGKKKPKQVVVDLFDGVRAVARVLDITPGAVSRWVERVPQRHHERLLEAAREKRLTLTCEMLTLGV